MSTTIPNYTLIKGEDLNKFYRITYEVIKNINDRNEYFKNEYNVRYIKAFNHYASEKYNKSIFKKFRNEPVLLNNDNVIAHYKKTEPRFDFTHPYYYIEIGTLLIEELKNIITNKNNGIASELLLKNNFIDVVNSWINYDLDKIKKAFEKKYGDDYFATIVKRIGC